MKKEEYIKLLDIIKEKCGFYNYPHNLDYKMIKYVECSYDTRDGSIWRIVFPEYETAFRDFSMEQILEFIKK